MEELLRFSTGRALYVTALAFAAAVPSIRHMACGSCGHPLLMAA